MHKIKEISAKWMVATAVAIILLHTFVPHHHHDIEEEMACCGHHHATCLEHHHDQGSDHHPYHTCKLQQILAQLALSDRDDRILILTTQPVCQLDLCAPERSLDISYFVPSVALPAAIALAASPLRGPPVG